MDRITSPVKAIREFCLGCCGGSRSDVAKCTSRSCALYDFRFGKNPFINRKLTDQQKEAMAARLAAAREKKVNTDDV